MSVVVLALGVFLDPVIGCGIVLDVIVDADELVVALDLRVGAQPQAAAVRVAVCPVAVVEGRVVPVDAGVDVADHDAFAPCVREPGVSVPEQLRAEPVGAGVSVQPVRDLLRDRAHQRGLGQQRGLIGRQVHRDTVGRVAVAVRDDRHPAEKGPHLGLERPVALVQVVKVGLRIRRPHVQAGLPGHLGRGGGHSCTGHGQILAPVQRQRWVQQFDHVALERGRPVAALACAEHGQGNSQGQQAGRQRPGDHHEKPALAHP